MSFIWSFVVNCGASFGVEKVKLGNFTTGNSPAMAKGLFCNIAGGMFIRFETEKKKDWGTKKNYPKTTRIN